MIQEDLANFASKKFGQNFLQDKTVLTQIIQAMPKDDLNVVEIGPGLGDLTKELLVAKRNVTAYEVDNRLCEHLSGEFKPQIKTGQLQLHCGDVLERWRERPLQDEPYHLVANLPYYIATHILLKALKDEQCQSILVMVQLEVAKKFAAQSKEKSFSALSVLTQSCGEASICFEVPPQAFIPPPKVTSAVLLIKKEQSRDDESFEGFLGIAFKQPRKTLAKNLSQLYAKEAVNNAFELLSLKTTLRPHEMMTNTYHELYKILKEDINGREKERTKSK